MGDPSKKLKNRAEKIYARLKKEYPNAKVRLEFDSPFELLVATILAAQCTDEKVNEVTDRLFDEADSPEAMAEMNLQHLQSVVRPTGFYRNKAKNIRNMSKALVEKHDGEVPESMDELTSLPGVARKTANVVRTAAFGKAGIVVDTHVKRLSQRLGLTDNSDPDKIERDLQPLLHPNSWEKFCHCLAWHGRAVCTSRKPACDECVVSDLCPSAFDFDHFKND